MTTDLIRLKIKQETSSEVTSLLIKETFIKACKNLNTSIFEPLIWEDQYFQDLDKYRFLKSMKDQFDYLKGEGIEEVKLVNGICKMCFKGDKVLEFYVVPNKGRPAFSYNIQEEGGKIKDIFRCNYSDGYQRDSRKSINPDITILYYD